MVKKLDPWTSSHKSNPVLFLVSINKLPNSRDICAIPVLRHIAQVILNNRPYNGTGSRGISVVDKPSGVCNQSRGTKCRTIPLRAAPSPSKSSLVGIELGLAQPPVDKSPDGFEIV